MQDAMLSLNFVESLRSQFPALSRQCDGLPAVYFDGPAGTQVPDRVIQAISKYLSHCNANHEGAFATSRDSDSWIDRVHEAAADFVGAIDPGEIVFGANMTTLTLHLSRSIARTWKPGDEIIVTQLDHDANVRPWVLAAQDAGVTVHFVPVNVEDCTLDMEFFDSHLSEKTRLVAVGCASNSVGTINPFVDMARKAHEVGALVFMDAVHYAPHAMIDVAAWDCDFLVCSAYKFFGPHQGILWGRRSLLEKLEPYKLNPCSDELPGRWMTGTQNFECLVGVMEAIDYIASIGESIINQRSDDSYIATDAQASELIPERIARENNVIAVGNAPSALTIAIEDPSDRESVERVEFILGRPLQCVGASKSAICKAIDRCYGVARREALTVAYEAIKQYETELCKRLIAGLLDLKNITVAGITDPQRSAERMPTVSIYHSHLPAEALAEGLDEAGIFAWHGNYYAWELSHALGREPDGMLRLGVVHYNTPAEVERTIEALRQIVG